MMLRIPSVCTILVAGIATLWALIASVSAAPTPQLFPGQPLKSHAVNIGDPVASGDLTVFPIYGPSDPKFADAMSLEEALNGGHAQVREQGTAPSSTPAQVERPASSQRTSNQVLHRSGGSSVQSGPNVPVQQQRVVAGGATVGTLVIENRSDQPIVVLAGTVVKGGKQDRQIAQDFVLAPKQTTPVDAFCVEQGRWSGVREGKNTGGQFSSTGLLAPSKVRVAAQHKSNQSKVWEEVAKTNAAAKKRSKSGTLMATYGAKDLVARRKVLAQAVDRKLNRVAQSRSVVGIAYAVGSQIRGVRWFASRELFERHRDKMLQSASAEALTDRPGAGDKPRALTRNDVQRFIEGVAKAKPRNHRKTKGLNANTYRENEQAYAAEARLGDVPLTIDISAK